MSSRVEKIQAAFAAQEGRRHNKVYKADEIPLSFESITDAWLTAALCSGHPGAQVTGHQLGPVDSGSSNRRKIAVQYNAAGQAAGLPGKLFCKATHDLANRIVLGISGGAQGEVDFYNHIRPFLDIEAPVSFFAAYDPDSINSIILLRDISDEVTSFCDHSTEMTRARIESELSLLAKSHAKGLTNPAMREQMTRVATWPEFFNKTLDFGMKAGSSKGFLDGKEVIPPALYARFDEIWPATMASIERHNVLPQTLCHGDVHLKNWYIAGNGEMGLSDWQCVHRGHWSRDVCYAIASALTVENRRAWDKDLLQFYLGKLAAAGGPQVTFEEGWLNFRQQMTTALTWWTITLAPTKDIPDMQPMDITLEMVRRMSTAMDDIDSLGSYG